MQRENRDFATMCVEAQEQNIAATNLYVVLPPSTVTQAARSSSTIGAVGSRLGTAHVIARMLTNKASPAISVDPLEGETATV